MIRSPNRQFPLLLASVIALLAGGGSAPGAAQTTAFAQTIAELSEPGGYFDTDNLISNERSYLSVLSDFERAGLRGGVYVGVGPDQNFSYIAHLRPELAVIVDIRRDNLLLHLLFKALFAVSPNRTAYLAQLVGRAPPALPAGASVQELAAAVDRARQLDAAAVDALRRRLDTAIAATGVPLSPDDRTTIDRFHRTFIAAGLDLQFTSTGRPPQSYYPTYRDLLLETDERGRPGHFLATDESYAFMKSLQDLNGVVPVTGDLAGRHALAALGRRLAARNQQVTAVYASNVEFYLRRSGTLARFYDNLRALPLAPGAALIRSRFGGGSSSSEVQSIAALIGVAAR
jgi:hypothetical protein